MMRSDRDKQKNSRQKPRQSGNRLPPDRRKNNYPLWPGLILLVVVLSILAMQNRPLKAMDWPAWLSGLPFGAGQTEEITDPSTNAAETSLSEPTSPAAETGTDPDQPHSGTEQNRPDGNDTVRIELASVGDLLMHLPITDGGLVDAQADPPIYDFRPNFKYIAPLIQRADLAVFNLETTFAGPPYSGFPLFSAPEQVSADLMDAGFNVASTANNHIIDKGIEGFMRTTRILQEQGYYVLGTRLTEDQPRDAIVDIQGLKVGMTAYTFETIGSPEQRTLNSLPIPDQILPLLNSFNPYRPEAYASDLKAMLDHAADLKERGAEFIFFVIHWGEEYQNVSRPYQREMAQALVDAGVDLIFGHHPHVLQEIDVLKSAHTGRPGLVFYSLGNLVTNVTYDMLGLEGRSQDSMIARVQVVKDAEGVRIEQAEYIPAHIIQASDNGRTRHYVVPVLPAIDDPEAYQTTEAIMRDALRRIESVMQNNPSDAKIPISQARQ